MLDYHLFGLIVASSLAGCPATAGRGPVAGRSPAMDLPRFADALASVQRSPGIPPGSDIYAPFLGSWDVEVIDHRPDGSVARSRGEWHFARVLEGRAVQDVWIVPRREHRTAAPGTGEGNRYGTSLRIYDPERDVWRVTWLNPVTQAEDRLIGREDNGDVVHLGDLGHGKAIRWTFGQITRESFVWRGEATSDGGRTWRLEAEFFAHRAAGPQAAPPAAPSDDLLWASPDRTRYEHVRLREGEDGFTATGLILRKEDRTGLRLRYRIDGDASWRVRRVEIASLDDDRPTFVLVADGAGRWVDAAGRALTTLNGCIDVDLQASPFTNTIPIRRLALDPAGVADITVAFVTIPDLSVQPAHQRYTRLLNRDREASYRYENLDSEFTAELPVDARGLLLEYPGYFTRLWGPGR